MPHTMTTASDDLILIDKPRPHTTVITMNRPERMNSMAFELMVPLHDALDEVAADNDTTCVILTGTGKGLLLRRRHPAHRRWSAPEHRRHSR